MKTPAGPVNPFPGLRPFREGEEHLFFGREAEVDRMVDKLARGRFLAVLGASGSGKSSLVNCGLRPALHRGLMAGAGAAWKIVTCRPGVAPFAGLAQALAADGVLFPAAVSGDQDAPPRSFLIEATLRMGRLGLVDIVAQARLESGASLLVIVDQFEELFRFSALAQVESDGMRNRAQDDAKAFVNLLQCAIGQPEVPIYVVMSMRSDFLGDCATYPGLAAAIDEGQYLVPRMSRDERRAAIAGPIMVAGAAIEPALLTRLVNDVGDEPDQLSILQHALHRTVAEWARDTGGTGPIAERHYEAIGTMARALDQHAEEAWATLRDERQRKLCERLFKALTDQVSDARGVRRPAHLGALAEIIQAAPAEIRPVIDLFRAESCSFLMPAPGSSLDDASVIDIAHESLMRIWGRLRNWAGEEGESAKQLRRLADAAEQWRLARGGLWRNPALQFALQWRLRQEPNPAWAAQYHCELAPVLRFLDESESARAQESALAERSAAWRSRATVLALLLLAGAGAVFFSMWQRTERLLVEANFRKMVLTSRAMFEGDVPTTVDHALQLSAAAYGLRAEPETLGGLQYALGRTANLVKVTGLPGVVLAFSADRGLAATADGMTVRIVAVEGGTPIGPPLQGHTNVVSSAAFSGDARRLVTASEDETVRRWNVTTGLPEGPPLRGHGNRVWCVAVSADGRLIASGDEDGAVFLWNGETGERVGTLKHHRLRVWALAFSPDGRTLASAGDDGDVILWDLASQQTRAVLQGGQGVVSAVAFSPDGRLLASGGGDNKVHLWDAGSGKARGAPLAGHASRIWSLAFSPDGHLLASGAEDRTVRLWEVAGGQPVGVPLAGHKGRVWRVAFSDDGRTILSGASDRALIRWQREPIGTVAMPGAAGPVRGMAYSPDGRTLVTAGDDGRIRLWSELGRPGLVLPTGSPSVGSVAVSADGSTLAAGTDDGLLRQWSMATGASVGVAMNGKGGQVWSVAFSPDGKTIATGSADAKVRVWDAGNGRLLAAAQHGTKAIWSLAFAPDGHALASGSEEGSIQLWQLAGDQLLAGARLLGHTERVWSVAFAPGGATLASGSADGTAKLWNVADGKERGAPLRGHEAAVTGVAFSPDGGILATASEDATVRFWNASDGAVIGRPVGGHQGAINALAFSPDGKSLATAGDDRLVRIQDAPSSWLGRVCAKVSGNLSHTAWQAFAGDVAYREQCPGLPLALDDAQP